VYSSSSLRVPLLCLFDLRCFKFLLSPHDYLFFEIATSGQGLDDSRFMPMDWLGSVNVMGVHCCVWIAGCRNPICESPSWAHPGQAVGWLFIVTCRIASCSHVIMWAERAGDRSGRRVPTTSDHLISHMIHIGSLVDGGDPI
jgi:hypothetical protein